MSGRLIESLATTPALAVLFSDESVLQAMLEFEAALARAEAQSGVIPRKPRTRSRPRRKRATLISPVSRRRRISRRNAGDSAGESCLPIGCERPTRMQRDSFTGERPARMSPTPRCLCCSNAQNRF